MHKIMNVVIQDRCELNNPTEFVESFEIRKDVHNPKKALRQAVEEFVLSETEEAKSALSYANGCFNWGDVFGTVPESLFIKHGLMPIKREAIDVFVDHNEILVKE